MNPTVFYLIRHAESSPCNNFPESKWPLNSKGVEQSKSLARKLNSLKPHHIYSSPFLRAIKTIELTAKHLNLPINLNSSFQERKIADGLFGSSEEFEATVKKAWTDFNFALEGCESSSKAQSRALIGLSELKKRHKGKIVLISSHGNIIGLILNNIDPKFGFYDWKSLKTPDIIKIIYEREKMIWDQSFVY